jgi:hypothetical protein
MALFHKLSNLHSVLCIREILAEGIHFSLTSKLQWNHIILQDRLLIRLSVFLLSLLYFYHLL